MGRTNTVAIIGVGLIGGSLGLALKKKKIAGRVIGIGRNGRRLARAKAIGAVDEYTTDFKLGVEAADVVVIAVPVTRTVEMIRKFRASLRNGVLVTDVGSVKESVVGGGEKFLAGRAHFVGAHPMAGSEKSGVMNASADLFKGSTCVLTKTRRTDIKALKKVRDMWTKVGANVLVTDPIAHDMMVSEVSHLPHVLAYLLALQVGESNRKNSSVAKVFAGAFRDMTRIAGSSPELWADICVDNRKALLKSMNMFEKNFVAMKKLMEERSKDGLLKKFEKARGSREGLLKSATNKR